MDNQRMAALEALRLLYGDDAAKDQAKDSGANGHALERGTAKSSLGRGALALRDHRRQGPILPVFCSATSPRASALRTRTSKPRSRTTSIGAPVIDERTVSADESFIVDDRRPCSTTDLMRCPSANFADWRLPTGREGESYQSHVFARRVAEWPFVRGALAQRDRRSQ